MIRNVVGVNNEENNDILDNPVLRQLMVDVEALQQQNQAVVQQNQEMVHQN